MSIWWDPHVERYRSTFPHKCVFGFGWPIVRWIMFNFMPCEVAHHIGIKAIRWFSWIDRIWVWTTIIPMSLYLLGICLPVTWVYIWFWKKTGWLMVGSKPEKWIESPPSWVFK